MGSFGPGIFDNDIAGDTVDAVQAEMFRRIVAFLRTERVEVYEEMDRAVACLAIAGVLHEHCGGHLPGEKTVKRWREQLLRLYDESVGQSGAHPEYVQARRMAIVDAFAKVLTLAQKDQGPEWDD